MGDSFSEFSTDNLKTRLVFSKKGRRVGEISIQRLFFKRVIFKKLLKNLIII